MDALTLMEYGFTYPGEERPVLSGVNLSVRAGEFALLLGATGSGKTTLLRSIKREVAPVGNREGRILLFGEEQDAAAQASCPGAVGFVMQSPENQLVMDTVWQEMAFGLENMGIESAVIRRRVAETAHFFGIGSWFERKVWTLSGGQKQILNLASVMAMQPRLLLLDEPTAQLDPVAARDFLQMLAKINRELGTTVVLSEHRMEEICPLADRMIWLREGRIALDAPPSFVIRQVYEEKLGWDAALPAAARLAHALGEREQYPLSVREGREWLASHQPKQPPRKEKPAPKRAEKPIIEAKKLWFRYEKEQEFVLRGVDFSVAPGEIFALVGGNGSGKSTLLRLLAGVERPAKGKVRKQAGVRSAMLVQHPKAMFLKPTLKEDLAEWQREAGYSDARIQEIAGQLGLLDLMDRHPYDLSGGEMQKAALAKLLLLSPDLLLLDEPAKGLDAFSREELSRILLDERAKGRGIVLVTHDLDFAAQIADTCAMMFGGEIVSSAEGRAFFSGNLFYTTGINRITRDWAEGCVTLEDITGEA